LLEITRKKDKNQENSGLIYLNFLTVAIQKMLIYGNFNAKGKS